MVEDNNQQSTNGRRKRRITRIMREKTPDPGTHNLRYVNEKYPDDVNVVSMQICPPRIVSAHESKILRRRDRNTAGAIASRSLSQPRQAEKLSDNEADEVIRNVKRSLSIPRKSDGNGNNSPEEELTRYNKPSQEFTEENLSRSARNLLRFEQNCKQLEHDQRLFEREHCKHFTRYRQLFSTEEKRQLLRYYRKLSDHYIKSDTDSQIDAEKREVLKESVKENPIKSMKTERFRNYEQATVQLSSSENENVQISRETSKNQSKRQQGASLSFSEKKQLPSTTQLRRRARGSREKQEAQNSVISKQLPTSISMRKRSIRENVLRDDAVDHVDGVTTVVDLNVAKISKESDNTRTKSKILTKFTNLFNFLKRGEVKKPSNDLQLTISTTSQDKLPGLFIWLITEWQNYLLECSSQLEELRKLRNLCISHLIVLLLLIGFGGLLFRYTEGTAENVYKCEVRKVKRDFIEQLWLQSHNMREEDWKNLARQKLRKFEEELHNMNELGLRYYPGQKSWNFVNSILFCWTVITTIGYGHITPKTTLGQSLTIVYAIIGIPMFLILLADFGKLLTRTIKLLWGYVRRVYYTGTCRKIRKQQHISKVMSEFTVVYDLAVQHPSQSFDETGIHQNIECNQFNTDKSPSQHPGSIAIDDEFNLPVSLASVMLVSYILVGAFIYTLWEDWSYFEAFYFVFISMSTIGFGDFVPNHPIFMMCSIIYLVFGLALTSMFINVVQIKLSDTFKQASTKIGATIGLTLSGKNTDKLSEHIASSNNSIVTNYQSDDKISNTDNQSTQGSPKARLAPSSTNSM